MSWWRAEIGGGQRKGRINLVVAKRSRVTDWADWVGLQVERERERKGSGFNF